MIIRLRRPWMDYGSSSDDDAMALYMESSRPVRPDTSVKIRSSLQTYVHHPKQDAHPDVALVVVHQCTAMGGCALAAVSPGGVAETTPVLQARVAQQLARCQVLLANDGSTHVHFTSAPTSPNSSPRPDRPRSATPMSVHEEPPPE